MHADEPIETDRVYRSMDEIKQRHPSEWVVIVDWTFPDMHLTGGGVIAHSPNRRALKPISSALPSCGVIWTGRARHPAQSW